MTFKVTRVRPPSKRSSSSHISCNGGTASSNNANCKEKEEGAKNSVLINVDIGHSGGEKGKCFPAVSDGRRCFAASGDGEVDMETKCSKQSSIKVINGV